MVATSIWCVASKVDLDFHVPLIAMLRVERGSRLLSWTEPHNCRGDLKEEGSEPSEDPNTRSDERPLCSQAVSAGERQHSFLGYSVNPRTRPRLQSRLLHLLPYVCPGAG